MKINAQGTSFIHAVVPLLSMAALAGGCTAATPDVGSASSALTSAECNFFDVNGKVRICHATGSVKTPYTIIQVSDSGCINGHAGHVNDYVATAGDEDCKGGGCFPVGAPVDPKIPCCPGLVAKNGICADQCAGVTCAASDQCHTAGVCDPNTGKCSNPTANDGTGCSDGNACTRSDACVAGTCTGTNPVLCTALDQCHTAGSCDPNSGLCGNPAAPDGTGCNDGNACTTNDVCNAGNCAGTAPNVVTPAHQWTFNGDGNTADSIGGASGTLHGGAVVTGGQLVVHNENTPSVQPLDASGQYMQAFLPDNIGVKTLVTWVSLANLTQHGGSGLSIELTTNNPFAQFFDTVDFGERTAKQWMSGSENFARSPLDNGGALEMSTAEVMVAIVYDVDNSITLYHNGQPYALSYVQGALRTYSGGASDALVGLRHSGCSNNCWLSGSIDEARIYNVPLTACQIQALQPVP